MALRFEKSRTLIGMSLLLLNVACGDESDTSLNGQSAEEIEIIEEGAIETEVVNVEVPEVELESDLGLTRPAMRFDLEVVAEVSDIQNNMEVVGGSVGRGCAQSSGTLPLWVALFFLGISLIRDPKNR